MKIAYFSPILRYGGDVTHSLEIAKKLVIDNEVVFINSIISKKFRKLKKIPFTVKFLPDIKSPLLNLFSPYYYLPKHYKIFQDFDIIHSSVPRLNILAVKIKKELGIPLIYTPNMIPKFSLNNFQIENTLLYFLVTDWLRIGLKNANAVIVPTKFEQELIRKKFHVNSVIIPNGIHRSNFLQTPDYKFKQKLSIQNKKVILFVGQIRESKGIHVLIKALKIVKDKFPNIVLLCVGEPPSYKSNQYLHHLKKLSNKLGLSNIVKFLGSIPYQDLISAYSIADIFILPSTYYEYQGIVLLEAMASNVPVIGSSFGGIPDVVIDRKNGLIFKNGDYFDLSDKIIELFENHDLRDQIIRTANEIIDKKYRWENAVNNIIKIYKKFIQ
ncbi:MAG: glycosyltransferase family 4 protein [Candidatus Helarchaeota archaeon]